VGLDPGVGENLLGMGLNHWRGCLPLKPEITETAESLER